MLRGGSNGFEDVWLSSLFALSNPRISFYLIKNKIQIMEFSMELLLTPLDTNAAIESRDFKDTQYDPQTPNISHYSSHTPFKAKKQSIRVSLCKSKN